MGSLSRLGSGPITLLDFIGIEENCCATNVLIKKTCFAHQRKKCVYVYIFELVH